MNRQSLSRAAALLITTVASLAMLSGCALLEGPTVVAPDRPTVQKPQETVAPEELKLHPDGTAEQNRDFFVATLYEVAENEAELSSVGLAEHFLAAGFVADQLQVSFDTTPTGLVADSLYISARFETQCLLGQIDNASREVFVSVEETVGPEADLCLIGETFEIPAA